MSQREMYGASYRVKEKITPATCWRAPATSSTRSRTWCAISLMRNRSTSTPATVGSLTSTPCVSMTRPAAKEQLSERVHRDRHRHQAGPADGVEFDEDRVLDSDGILDLKSLPSTMVVVGAGVIGIEYASMFAALWHQVTVVEKRDNMLDFCDPEIVEALKFHLRDLAVTFRFGEEVTAVDVGAAGTVTTLASGKQIPAETVMYRLARRQTNIWTLPTPGSKPTTADGICLPLAMW